MKIKVICQLCGKVDEIDLGNDWKGWRYYLLSEIFDSDYLMEDDIPTSYKIWFCPECLERYLKGQKPIKFKDVTDEFLGRLIRSLGGLIIKID